MTIHHDDIDRWVKQICAALEAVAKAIEESAPTDDALDTMAEGLADMANQFERIADVLEKGMGGGRAPE